MKSLLKKLSEACGISGFEDEVREILKDELKVMLMIWKQILWVIL